MVKRNSNPQPFSEVIREYPEPEKKSSDNKSKTQELKPTEDTRSYDELLEQLNGLKSKQEQFIFACVNGSDEVSFELLKHLLEQSGTTTVKLDKIVDKQNGDASLLHLCAQRNKVACLELLTSHNLKVDILDKLQASPLIHAAALNCQDAATFLALKGANMNLKDDYNRFPLLAALKNKHYAMAETLAEQRGLDVDLRGTGGNTALHTMASEGDLQAVKILIENCKAVLLRRNNNENNVLMCALEHPDVVEYLCSKVTPQNLYKMAVHTNVDGRHVVHLCAANGWINSLLIIFKSLSSANLTKEEISTLLNERDKEEDTPLLLATKNNQVEMVKLLCKFQELRVNMGDFKGKTALTYALHSDKNKEISKAIADAGGSLKNEEELAEKKRSPLTNYCLSMNNLLALLMVSFGFICILIIAAIGIGYFGGSMRSTTQLIRETYFNDISSFVQYKLDAVAAGESASFSSIANSNMQAFLSNETLIQSYTWRLMNAGNTSGTLTSAAYCGDTSGNMAGFFYDALSYSVYYYTTYTGQQYVTKYGPFNYGGPVPQMSNGAFVNTTAQTLLQQNFYTAALNQSQIGVTPVWTSSVDGITVFREKRYFSLTRPLFNSVSNAFIGYCAVDVGEPELVNVFTDKANHPQSVAIIVDGNNGNMVAISIPGILSMYDRISESEEETGFAASSCTSGMVMPMPGNPAPPPPCNMGFMSFGANKRILDIPTDSDLGMGWELMDLAMSMNMAGMDMSQTPQQSLQRLIATLNYGRSAFGGPTFPELVGTNPAFKKVMINGRSNAFDIGRRLGRFNMNIVVFETMPMIHFNRTFFVTIGVIVAVTVGILVFSSIAAVFIAYLFMRPLRSLTRLAESIKTLKIEKVEEMLKRKSNLTEIRLLQESYESMSQRLKQFRSFIPAHILTAIDAEMGELVDEEAEEAEVEEVVPEIKEQIKEEPTKVQETGEQNIEKVNEKPADDNLTGSIKRFAGDLSSIDKFSAMNQKKHVRSAGTNQVLNSELKSGNITVMMVRLPNLAEIMDKNDSKDVMAVTKELFSAVKESVQKSLGQLVYINSNAAVIAWNTFILQNNHCMLACKAARHSIDTLKKLQQEWKKNDLPVLSINIGLASGNCFFGNIGPDSMKFFTLVGSTALRAEGISGVAKKWKVPVLMDQYVHDHIKEYFLLRPIDHLEDKHDNKMVTLYELGDLKPSDSWVNELQDTNSIFAWKLFTEAYELYEKQDFRKAFEKFSQYVEKYPEDTVAAQYLEFCRDEAENNDGDFDLGTATMSILS